MDETTKEIENEGFAIEEINSGSFLFRIVGVKSTVKRDDKRRFPNEATFGLKPNEKGLSLNWNKYCCEKKSLIVKGLTKSKFEPYKFIDISPNIVFKFPSEVLEQCGELKHTPIYNGNPSPEGDPNNISHFELFHTGDDDLKMRLHLAQYCNEKYEESFCQIEMKKVILELDELKLQGNDTPYHKNWVF